MYTFNLQNFLYKVLLPTASNPPSIDTPFVIEGPDETDVANSACSMMPTVFTYLNDCNGTNYRYPDYYRINPDTGSGTDEIIILENGIMDTPYLKEYIMANCIIHGQPVSEL